MNGIRLASAEIFAAGYKGAADGGPNLTHYMALDAFTIGRLRRDATQLICRPRSRFDHHHMVAQPRRNHHGELVPARVDCVRCQVMIARLVEHEPFELRYPNGDFPGCDIMLVYVGHRREAALAVAVERLGDGMGAIACLECGGDGEWSRFMPEPVVGGMACVPCKGTGRQLIAT